VVLEKATLAGIAPDDFVGAIGEKRGVEGDKIHRIGG